MAEKTRREQINEIIRLDLEIIRLWNKEIIRRFKEWLLQDEDRNLIKEIKNMSMKRIDLFTWSDVRIVNPKLRFKILNRDKFTCQYCWIKWWDVLLQIDHIIPWSKWWKTIEENLITSCFECNIWKWDSLIIE